MPKRSRKKSAVMEDSVQKDNNLDMSDKGRCRRNVFIIMNNSTNVSSDCNTIYNIPALDTNPESLQDLAHCFKYFLLFGRLIGLIPILGLCRANVESIHFK